MTPSYSVPLTACLKLNFSHYYCVSARCYALFVWRILFSFRLTAMKCTLTFLLMTEDRSSVDRHLRAGSSIYVIHVPLDLNVAYIVYTWSLSCNYESIATVELANYIAFDPEIHRKFWRTSQEWVNTESYLRFCRYRSTSPLSHNRKLSDFENYSFVPCVCQITV